MNINEIMQYLPHRYPFLLVDRIIDLQPGKSITGIKNVTFNEPFFRDISRDSRLCQVF